MQCVKSSISFIDEVGRRSNLIVLILNNSRRCCVLNLLAQLLTGNLYTGSILNSDSKRKGATVAECSEYLELHLWTTHVDNTRLSEAI